MHYIWQHIESIISSYDGTVPLVHFLKNYYRQYPKLGSRDRKMLSEMAYSWNRCSKALDITLTLKEKIAACLQLCHTDNTRLLQLTEGFSMTHDIQLHNLFPYELQLSGGITKEDWLRSMLTQPSLFIRIRKSKSKLLDILEEQEIPYEPITDSCLALPNGTPVDKWLPPYAYVVQDASSQKTGEYFTALPYEKWWDACSGAGGKSLLLKDKEPLVDLTVSDTRKSILNNLKERFRTYSHIMPMAYEVDVANASQLNDVMRDKLFDNIICDVPCTGSGTWARTPEQMYFFNQRTADEYADRQKQIAVNAAQYLQPEGKLYYITCSVFSKENEAVVQHLVKQTGMKLTAMQLINGIDIHADSMFIAVLEKQV